jgi:hypothetical protein
MKRKGMYLLEGITAMAIQANEPILYDDLVQVLKGLVKKETLPRVLSNLRNWGYLTSEHTTMGHMYLITGEADPMVRELRELYWEDTKARGRWWWRLYRWLRGWRNG